ncbi:OmpA family protein [Mesorhizobium sp.]|uniref:OmpA family protein n=1 Tax=Mesorhizobium sp. TaxID=1871066 RepID=UPI001213CEA8|nr:OmpA family protein [Mesorhizobium sp.]TIL46881.1 MAG: flagellar motor protein MotB [Mesorhizobium sp.]
MKRQPRILAGTALGLLMASAPLGAFPLQGSAAFDPPQSTATPLIPVQSNCPEGETAEGCAPQGEPEQKPRKKRERQAESAPAEQAAPSGEEQQGGQRRKKREQQQQEEAAEQAAPASDEQPEPRRKKRDRQQQEEAAPAERPAEQAAPASDEQPEPRRKKRDRQQQEEAAPAEKPAEQAAPASDEQPEPRRKKRDRQQQQEAEQAAPRENAAPANDNEQVTPRRKKREQDQQIEAAPSEQPARKEAGEQAEPLPTDQQTAPAEGDKPRDQARERDKKPTDEQPVTGEQPSTGEQPAEREQAAPAEGEGPAQGEAPVFDSQKDAKRKRKGGRDNAQETVGQDAGGQPTQQNGEQAEAPKPAPVDQGPPPTDDRAAQQAIKLEKMVPVTEEKGRRVERAPDEENIRRRERPRGVDVVRELGDRVILQFNNQTIVESDDAPRMRRGARNVYYEELSGNRTREIVERDNGIQIVTIRNRYGDVVQRSRIAPDGREYVLSYVDERHYEYDGDWRDPGDDLPPIRIDLPREEYILDSEEVEDPDDYYAFLEQPPVERVQRLYSIDEVKRSARVRDIARRIDLDTLNFEFGSASIPETEVQKLEGVASAMEKLLEKNPAETFLIEGHTDAVGRPEANLALSDRRAEAVAEALSNAFSIPPENLTTQGYGEEYLKVDTSEPERENRRVAIRRITSLVAPVASAN